LEYRSGEGTSNSTERESDVQDRNSRRYYLSH
jgi:hypothetical protein